MPDPLVSEGPRRARGEGEEPGSLVAAERMAAPVRTTLFLLLYFGVDALCQAIALVPVAVPSALIPGYRKALFRPIWNWIVRFWGVNSWRCLRACMGVRLRTEGEIPAGRVLIVANHQSSADIPMLVTLFRAKNLKFVGKKELLRRGSIVGTAFRQAGFGLVDVSNPRKTLAGLAEYCRELEGWDGSAVLFPEGIRSTDGMVGTFQSSGVRLLAGRTGLPVLPVALDGAWRGRSMLQFGRLRGRTIRVRVLPVLGPFDRDRSEEELDALPGRLEQMIRSEVERMRSEGSR